MSRDKFFKGYNPDFISRYGSRNWQKDMERVNDFRINDVQPMFHGQTMQREPIEYALEHWLHRYKETQLDAVAERERADKAEEALAKINKIPWQKYDPENPPTAGRYIVSDGKNWCEGFYFSKEITLSGQYWGVASSKSNIPIEVIYYAPINLPDKEEDK